MAQNDAKVFININNNNKLEELNKCQEWLKYCHIDNENTESEEESLTDCSSSILSEFEEKANFLVKTDNKIYTNNLVCNKNEISSDLFCSAANLNTLIKKDGNIYENIKIYKSKKVHIGDITNIEGPVYVNQIIPEKDNSLNVLKKKKNLPSYIKDFNGIWIVPRHNWLAQPPDKSPEYLDAPAKFVIICHTATEEVFTESENTFYIRLMQTFHMEGHKWNDIAYNFLIGSNGSAYEGRGWGVRGAFAHKYNEFSLGIGFIGCFINHLPPQIALQKTQELIRYGVKIGAVAEDYKLLCHSQCTSGKSPGDALIKELQQWEHYDPTVSVNNPAC